MAASFVEHSKREKLAAMGRSYKSDLSDYCGAYSVLNTKR